MSAQRWVFAMLAASGCASGVPTRGTSTVVRAEGTSLSPDEAFGAQVELSEASRALRGELIGCDSRGVFLALNEPGEGRWQKVPWSAVRSLRIRREALGIAGWVWAAVGVLSSTLHGVYALASAPTWAAVGIPAAYAGFNPSITASDCAAVRAYARFPQGLPRALWPRFGAESSAVAPWDVTPSRETLAPEALLP